MAEQIIPGFFLIPDWPTEDPSPNYSLMLLDAALEKAAAIIQAPKTGTIKKIGFGTRVVTNGAIMDVRLETVGPGNNDPSGTLLGVNSNGSQVIGDIDDNTWFTTSLITPVAVTKGDIFAIVIVNPSGSPGNLEIAQINSATERGLPYGDLYTGSWVRSRECPCMALEYDDGSYGALPYVFPLSGLNQVSFSNIDTPDHRGLRFKLLFPYRLIGIWCLARLAGDPNLVLYDSDGTSVLETLGIDSDIRSSSSDAFSYYYFASNHSLAKDESYRVVFAPTSSTNIDLFDFDVNAAAIMDALPGGRDFHYTQKKDAGWTDITTKRPIMGLIIDGFDDGAGGAGGLLVHPGMAGGFRG